MASGTVKWFNMQKGYGFIQPDDGGKDVFVHITAVQAAGLNGLNDGQKVTYEVARERRRASRERGADVVRASRLSKSLTRSSGCQRTACPCGGRSRARRRSSDLPSGR